MGTLCVTRDVNDTQTRSMTSDDESNVVGTLFALNGEDDGYNPEDWVQDVAIDEKTSFRVSVAEDDGSIPGTLFACAIWNGAVRS